MTIKPKENYRGEKLYVVGGKELN